MSANIPGGGYFSGELDEVRLYRRALGEAELQGLVEPGRSLAERPPDKPQDVTLTLGGRQFVSSLNQPAFLAVRLAAGKLRLETRHSGIKALSHIVLTPLASEHQVTRSFLAFERRVPQLGVHIGLRRDCGSTLARVGEVQPVAGSTLSKYVFEGAIRDFPSPDVEKDNVNYLAGIREIRSAQRIHGRSRHAQAAGPISGIRGPSLRDLAPGFAPKHIHRLRAQGRCGPAYAQDILRSFAARSYRRPIAAEEEFRPAGSVPKGGSIPDGASGRASAKRSKWS